MKRLPVVWKSVVLCHQPLTINSFNRFSISDKRFPEVGKLKLKPGRCVSAKQSYFLI